MKDQLPIIPAPAGHCTLFSADTASWHAFSLAADAVDTCRFDFLTRSFAASALAASFLIFAPICRSL